MAGDIYCPLMSGPGHAEVCLKSNCGMFSDTKFSCAIAQLPGRLLEINTKLENLALLFDSFWAKENDGPEEYVDGPCLEPGGN